MEELIKGGTAWVVLAVEASATLIIAAASAEAVVGALAIWLRRSPATEMATDALRLRFARWLAVALEFTLAADILRTAMAPSWEAIGKLAAIAALRTLLNVFLQREIATAAAHQAREPGTDTRRDGTTR